MVLKAQDILTFGKYFDFTVSEVYGRNPEYLIWLHDTLGYTIILTEEEKRNARLEEAKRKLVDKKWCSITIDRSTIPETIEF